MVLEGSTAFDAAADRLQTLARRIVPAGPVKDLLSGTWLGHPLHPLLVGVPIGSWVGSIVLDFLPGQNDLAARQLVGFGTVSAIPAAAAGLSDWSDTSGEARRVGLAHAILNWAGIALFARSWWLRRKAGRGKLLALVGSTIMGGAGYLGGHLSYALGTGVDTNAFESGLEDWTPVAREDELREGQIRRVVAQGVSLALVRSAGITHVLSDRCSHRGGPVSEGELVNGCISCPWHGSMFRLEDGTVQRGPATRPQPSFEVRLADGNLQVRRR